MGVLHVFSNAQKILACYFRGHLPWDLYRATVNQASDTAYACFHLCSCRNVRRMHGDFGWLKVSISDLLFNPQHHIVTSSMGIIAEIVIEAQMGNSTSLQ